jgi:hypothetical protein
LIVLNSTFTKCIDYLIKKTMTGTVTELGA